VRALRFAALDARPHAGIGAGRAAPEGRRRERQPIDPALPLALLRARRQAEAAFPNERRVDWSPGDLVDAGIQAVTGWLKRNA
jgi:hypothetical protein